MTKITVYPPCTSGLTASEAKRIKAQRRPEPQSGIVRKDHSCPECGAMISARYAVAGYVCDACADYKENV